MHNLLLRGIDIGMRDLDLDQLGLGGTKQLTVSTI